MYLLEKINKSQIDRVISYSQDIPEPKTEELLTNWSNQKKGLSNEFLNRDVSYTHPEKVHFELDDDAKTDRIACFIEYVTNLLNNWQHPFVCFLGNLSTDEFYTNTLNRDYTITTKDNKKISKGSKVVKSFKYFIDDEKLLHDLQNKASEIIQENKVEGYLTFSIHPLDFLSSSENTYNWRSCHALDGEYRAGNLSYMCDRGTMIVFLSSDKQEKLPHFPEDVPWNSKKWRMLLHFNENLEVCFAGRQYPFSSPGALEVVKDIFCNYLVPFQRDYGFYSVIGENRKRQKWEGWYDDYVNEFKYKRNNEVTHIDEATYCVINQGIFNRFNMIKDAPNSRHFNDVTKSSCYDYPYYMFKHYWSPQTEIKFIIGSEVKCLRCGERTIDGDDSMMCPECECAYGTSDSDAYRTCDCCGMRVFYEDGSWVGDDWLCSNCFDTETFTCEDCGDTCYNSEKHWDEELKGYICDYCYKERNEE